jgi:GTP-sensing pleiotropic transcriptional regulator CodY
VIVSPSTLNSEAVVMDSTKSDEVSNEIMLQAIQLYEEQAELSVTSQSTRFAKPVCSEELKDTVEEGVPLKTKQRTLWSLNVWKSWAKTRIKVGFSTDY